MGKEKIQKPSPSSPNNRSRRLPPKEVMADHKFLVTFTEDEHKKVGEKVTKRKIANSHVIYTAYKEKGGFYKLNLRYGSGDSPTYSSKQHQYFIRFEKDKNSNGYKYYIYKNKNENYICKGGCKESDIYNFTSNKFVGSETVKFADKVTGILLEKLGRLDGVEEISDVKVKEAKTSKLKSKPIEISDIISDINPSLSRKSYEYNGRKFSVQFRVSHEGSKKVYMHVMGDKSQVPPGHHDIYRVYIDINGNLKSKLIYRDGVDISTKTKRNELGQSKTLSEFYVKDFEGIPQKIKLGVVDELVNKTMTAQHGAAAIVQKLEVELIPPKKKINYSEYFSKTKKYPPVKIKGTDITLQKLVKNDDVRPNQVYRFKSLNKDKSSHEVRVDFLNTPDGRGMMMVIRPRNNNSDWRQRFRIYMDENGNVYARNFEGKNQKYSLDCTEGLKKFIKENQGRPLTPAVKRSFVKAVLESSMRKEFNLMGKDYSFDYAHEKV